jgi:hypothetical protein
MEKLLEQLVEKLRRTYGDRLVSVVLYGSAAAGDYNPAYSDLNVLCVLTQVAARELADAEAIFRWWRGQGNPAPLLLSEQELGAGTDCFAVEFFDIQERHRILFGRDVVAGVTVDRMFYRAQVEHELRAKLLRLRQKASGIMSEEDLLRRLLVDSIATFCVLFRHALVLHGAAPLATRRDVLESVRERFGVDPAPFASLLDIRERRVRPQEVEPVALIGRYMEGIAVVIEAVDEVEPVALIGRYMEGIAVVIEAVDHLGERSRETA